MYTEPFLMIPGSFESDHSQLSNDPGFIKNGSVYIKIRVLKVYGSVFNDTELV